MRLIARIMTFALAIGVAAATQPGHAQQPTTDPRVADIVRAGNLRVGLGLGHRVWSAASSILSGYKGCGSRLSRSRVRVSDI